MKSVYSRMPGTSMTLVLFLGTFGWLAISCSGSTQNSGELTVPVSEVIDDKSTASPSPSSTSTPSATATETPTPTPSATPTPFGGAGLRFAYTDWEGNLRQFDRGPILTKEQIESSIGRTFDYAQLIPSSAFSSVLVEVWDNRPGWTEYLYISSMMLEDPIFLSSGRPSARWSPNGRQALVIEDNSMYLVNADGRGRIPIGPRYPKDGYPSWSPDSMSLYWTRDGQLRVIDAETGKSVLIEADWLDDFIQVFQFEFSPSGDRVTFRNHGLFEGRKLYIAKADFTDPVSISLDREDSYVWKLLWSATGDAILVYMSTSDPDCRAECAYVDEYYILDPDTLAMHRLEIERLGIEEVEYYQTDCGLTPDGKNLIIAADGFYYFFEIAQQELAQKIQVDGSCPAWLPPDFQD